MVFEFVMPPPYKFPGAAHGRVEFFTRKLYVLNGLRRQLVVLSNDTDVKIKITIAEIRYLHESQANLFKRITRTVKRLNDLNI